jgi:hypothetical protein
MRNNPLDGDLFGGLPEPEAKSPLMAAGPLMVDEGAPLSTAPMAGDVSTLEPLAEEAQPDEPKPRGPGFLARLAQSNPYAVMLVVSVVALLIGILSLLLEWGSYGFDTKASEVNQSTRLSAPSVPSTASPPGTRVS